MSHRLQNQVCKGTLEDKGENVHFVVDRDNTDNSEKNGSTKRLNIFESKTILIEEEREDVKFTSCHAPPKTLQWLPIQGCAWFGPAYLSIFHVLLVFLRPLNTLAMVNNSTFAQVAVSFCLSPSSNSNAEHLFFRSQLTTGWIWFASHYTIRIGR